ncbi:hypothetical protein [Sorangium cellulosum]|uniref:hypothetical protein n=1 Tax=Sorangium cellulosum TaxID=56 RepID=UPI000416D975|nr:hypothetical protein [Sorangium cellulosum]
MRARVGSAPTSGAIAEAGDSGGNVARAAGSMGVSRQLVHRLVERYGIRSKG